MRKLVPAETTLDRREQYIKLPMRYFEDETFTDLPMDARLLHALMVDQLNLSKKQDRRDKRGDLYITFPIERVRATLGVGLQKACNLMKRLEARGLIRRHKRGQGRPDMIYVMTMIDNTLDLQEREPQTSEDQNPRPMMTEIPAIPRPDTPINNHTDSQTVLSSPLSIPLRGSLDDRAITEDELKENIEYDWFIEAYEFNDPKTRPEGSPEMLENLVEIAVDAVCSNAPTIRVNGADIPKEQFTRRILSLNSDHVEYIFHKLRTDSAHIKNLRPYLLTMMFNAPVTMDIDYDAEFARIQRG